MLPLTLTAVSVPLPFLISSDVKLILTSSFSHILCFVIVWHLFFVQFGNHSHLFFRFNFHFCPIQLFACAFLSEIYDKITFLMILYDSATLTSRFWFHDPSSDLCLSVAENGSALLPKQEEWKSKAFWCQWSLHWKTSVALSENWVHSVPEIKTFLMFWQFHRGLTCARQEA